MASPLTRQRRRELTREHLLEAAGEVFARDGFHGASIDAIAETAGFTKGAVYSNFESKDDLFLALLDARIAEQLAAIRDALRREGSDEDRLAELARTMTEMILERPGWTRLNLEFTMYAVRRPDALVKVVQHQRARHKLMAELVGEELQRHDIQGVSAAHVVALMSAVIDGIGLARLLDPGDVPDDLLGFALQAISAGLRA